MGLPSGTLWRDRNVGAGDPTSMGDFYAWAEILSKTSYTTDNYKFKGDGLGIDNVTKYNGNGPYGNGGDGRWNLKDGNYEDDAARSRLGSSWRIPSTAEWNELISNCTITSGKSGSVDGFIFKANNPDKEGSYNELFFPCGGTKNGTTLGYESDDSSYGEKQAYYWTDEVRYYTSGGKYYYVYANAAHIYPAGDNHSYAQLKLMGRWKGLMVRPVWGE